MLAHCILGVPETESEKDGELRNQVPEEALKSEEG